MRAGMSPGGRNTGSSGSMTAVNGGTRPASTSNVSRSAGSPCRVPRAHAFLQQPQPHDVAQKSGRAVDPRLVGEVCRPRGVCQYGLVEFDARPATRCHTRCSAKSGGRAGTPTTADAVSCEPTVVTATGPTAPSRPTRRLEHGRRASPGWRSDGNSCGSIPSLFMRLGRPLPSVDVVAAGSSRHS